MMTGRLGDSDGEAWPDWLFSASTSGMAACTPVPAATAPSTDVFTKSRRENVTSPPDRCSACQENYLKKDNDWRCRRTGKHITGYKPDSPGTQSQPVKAVHFPRSRSAARKRARITSRPSAKKLCGSLHPPPRARCPRDSRQDAGATLTCWRISASGRDRPSLPSVVDLQQQWKSAAHSPIGNAGLPRYFPPCR